MITVYVVMKVRSNGDGTSSGLDVSRVQLYSFHGSCGRKGLEIRVWCRASDVVNVSLASYAICHQ